MESVTPAPNRFETRCVLVLFTLSLLFSIWGVSVGWLSKSLPGVEFRQAQTAISTHFIQKERNFSLDYPTPVLGKPWSIPMEFPLYQWTTVLVSDVTGFAITKAGRLVSIVCFYLCLPALFLLLRRWKVDPVRRLLVLALVLACPFYIFYARAFLIETMALMFALWFWVGFERGVGNRQVGWILIAMLAGIGAGLVKVTTYMVYLLPPAIWAGQRLWQNRHERKWVADFLWMTAAVLLPFAATLWWLDFADGIKAMNPLAEFLRAEKLTGFNFGTNATRFSAEMWMTKWRMIVGGITAPALLGGLVILALLSGWRRWREILVCLGLFGIPLMIFPALYTYHAYYFVANTVLLLMAMGFVVISLMESRSSKWISVLVVAGIMGGQVYGYLSRYYPQQAEINPGGSPLTQSLRDLTRPNEYLAIAGYDWNSMMPYYARRRAVMFKSYLESDSRRIDEAFAQLKDEKLGALVIIGDLQGRESLIEHAVARGLDSTPLYYWHDAAVFLPKERREESLAKIEDHNYGELRYGPGVDLPHTRVANRWVTVSDPRPRQQEAFIGMNPRPERFFSTFGPLLVGMKGSVEFSAHPETRLVFALSQGEHRLRTKVGLAPGAYDPELAQNEQSDGVEVALYRLRKNGERQLLETRLVNPRDRAEDRGRVAIEMSFMLPESGEVELYIGPGPANSMARDWATLERVDFD